MPAQPPHAEPNFNMQSSNFTFQKRVEPIDWKRLAAIDLDSISRNLDFNALQDNILNVAFCNIESEVDVRTVDPNFVKLFKLAQLTIEYLLFSQDYLYGMISSGEEKLKTALQDNDETKKELDKQKAAIEELKKESHKRKKMLIAQQHIMNQGSAHYFKCMFCSKAFVNQSFLESHLSRRHPDMGPVSVQSLYQSQVQAPVVQAPQYQPTPTDGTTSNNKELEQQLRTLQARLQLAESQLLQERNSKNTPREKDEESKQQAVFERQIKNFEDTFRQEHQTEIDRLEKMFARQLKEAEEKRQLAEEKVEALQRRHGMFSSLGKMEDEVDLETEKSLLREQREEIAILKEELLQQRENLEGQMSNKLRNQDKKLRSQLDNQQEEMKQMSKALEDALQLLNQEKNERNKLESEHHQQAQRIQQLLEKSRDSSEKARRREARLSAQPASSIESSPVVPRASRPGQSDVISTPVMKMDDIDDDEDEDEDEESESEEEEDTEDGEVENELRDTTEYDSTMASTQGDPRTFGTGTLSPLSLTGTLKNKRLLADDIKSDPNVFAALKEQLSEFLDDQLAARGIPRGSTGIPDLEAERQLNSLKKERQQIAQNYPSFFNIRQEIVKEVNEKAKEKVKSQSLPRPAPSPSRPRVTPSPKLSSNTPQLSRSGPRDGGRESDRSNNLRPPTSHSPPPRPAPRTSGGKLHSSMQSSMTETGISTTAYSTTGYDTTGMSYTQTGDSKTYGSNTDRSQWDSDDGEDEVDQVPMKLRPQLRKPKAEESLSDFDDELSELEEVSTKKPGPSKSAKPSPQKGSVKELRDTIELQLQNRGKKPTGGISIMKSADSSKNKQSDSDIDDIFDEISSLEEEEPIKRRPSSQNRASSHLDTDKSSNTAATSMWGGSSQGGSNSGPRNRMTSADAQSSLVSVTDFDLSDEDLDSI